MSELSKRATLFMRSLKILRAFVSSLYAALVAGWLNVPGMRFANFGRRLGLRLLLAGEREGANYLITPVNIVRYFEFEFVHKYVESREHCLDVSSPRLFSIYMAKANRERSILMINPDEVDLRETRKLLKIEHCENVKTINTGVEELLTMKDRFDCIYAISVIEHINGQITDSVAVNIMYRSLKPNGRLILTLPVDRTHWDEYRRADYYGTQPENDNGLHFFQRNYDFNSITKRIFEPLGREPRDIEWFGERDAGYYAKYEKNWQEVGWTSTAMDPLLIATRFQRYSSWHEMPGRGVCGLVFEKLEC